LIVIADASPLNYLVLVGSVDVLKQLYGRVAVPSGVVREISSPGSPPLVRTWAAAPPEWIEIAVVTVPPEAGLEALDSGEAEAIVLAERHRPDVLLLIDDRDGRREATRRGIPITGTLGVLGDASTRGLLDLTTTLDRLRRTTFRISPALLTELIERERRRRGDSP
jgi:predicted nucleic acid-binding protein